MRLVLGSDLHGYLPDVPPCDILVLAGDILPETDQIRFIENYLRTWLNRVPAKHIVAIWGNHDHKPFRYWKDDFRLRWHLLQDQSISLMGLKFHGTPWCQPIGRWAWQAPDYILKYIYSLIPNDVDILVSHTPPYGMCDLMINGESVGSQVLLERINSLQNLKYLVCGHIHEARGRDGKVLNVSCLDENFELRKDPWTIIDL